MQYYVRTQGKVYGPYEESKMLDYIKDGRVTAETEVSTDRVTWSLAGSVAALYPGGPPEFQSFGQTNDPFGSGGGSSYETSSDWNSALGVSEPTADSTSSSTPNPYASAIGSSPYQSSSTYQPASSSYQAPSPYTPQSYSSSTYSNDYDPEYNDYPTRQSSSGSADTFAIASFVLGILSVFGLCCFVSFFTAIPGVILGYFGLKSSNNRSLGIAGLVLNIIMLVLTVVWLIWVIFVNTNPELFEDL